MKTYTTRQSETRPQRDMRCDKNSARRYQGRRMAERLKEERALKKEIEG